MILRFKNTGEEVKVGDVVQAQLNGRGKYRKRVIYEIIDPENIADRQGAQLTVEAQKQGLVKVDYIKSGDIGSWQQYYPYVLGMEFTEEESGEGEENN